MDINIYFGSETGNSENIAIQIANEIQAKINAKEYEVKSTNLKPKVLDEFVFDDETKLNIIICSSTGDGEPTDNAIKFNSKLDELIKQNKNFKNNSFILLGMGDSSYDLSFGLFPTKVYNDLSKLGFESKLEFIITDDDVGIDVVLLPWLERFWNRIGTIFSKKSLQNKVDETKVNGNDKEEKVNGNEKQDEINLNQTKDIQQSINDNSNEKIQDNLTLEPYFEHELVLDKHSLLQIKEMKLLPKVPIENSEIKYIENNNKHNIKVTKALYPNLIEAKVNSISCISDKLAVKRSLKMQVSYNPDQFLYQPGDCIAIIQPNHPTLVNKLIDRLNLSEKKYELVKLNNKVGELPSHLLPLKDNCCTIFNIVSYCVDIQSIPKKALFKLLAEYTQDPEQAHMLNVLSSKQGTEHYNLLRDQVPNLLEILNLFPSCNITLERLLDILPPLQHRYYSITTTPLNNNNMMEFMFNVVQYRTNNNHLRHGLFTSWIDRETQLVEYPHSKNNLNIDISFIKKVNNNQFYLPTNTKTPLILMAAGTGLAPILSFLRHRQYQRKMMVKMGTIGHSILQELENKFGKVWVIFGTRHPDLDFFEGQELLDMVKDNIIDRLDICFSRKIEDSFTLDNNIKTFSNCKYIQHVIDNNQQKVFGLLNKEANLFLCGDASNMAKEVNNALSNVILNNKDCFDPPIQDVKQANQQLLAWSKEGRIKRDLW